MKTVAWLVPSLIEGSGGHRTILQNAKYLKDNGFNVVIYLENDAGTNMLTGPSALIRKLFGYDFNDVRVGWGKIERADGVFATVWYSAKVVRDLPFECKKMYFVQDWEAMFNPMGDAYLLAENSYRYGLIPITIGNWLRHEIFDRFGVRGFSFDFCADLDVYTPFPYVKKDLAVCFICQPEKPRRGAALGIEALGIVKSVMPEVSIYLYGSKSPANVWFDHVDLGLIDLHECNALYNKSSVGLCISSSNPSRIPFEMMASGLPVVELYRDNTLYDLPDTATLLCDQTPESIAEGLLQLLRDESRRQSMRESAIAFMSGKHIDFGMQQFLHAVISIMQETDNSGGAGSRVERMYMSAPVVASPFVDTASHAASLLKANSKAIGHKVLKQGWLGKIIRNKF